MHRMMLWLLGMMALLGSPNGAVGAAVTGGGEDLGRGVWVIGWSGGLDHYSWLRFNFEAPEFGTFEVIDAECPSCDTYYGCEGSGYFWVAGNTAWLQFPEECTAQTGRSHSFLEFGPLLPPSGFFPSAIQEASVTETMWDEDGNPNSSDLNTARFRASHCDPAFASCGSPFE